MGNLVWHEFARLISLAANTYAVWAGFFGLFFRKFFWDFVGGTLRDPGGIQPSPKAAVFITVIVKFPIIQSIAIFLGLLFILLEFPVPPLKGSVIHRSFILRIVFLVFQATLCLLFYQGTNAALWCLIAAMCYVRALTLDEKMEDAKENIGKGGQA